MYCKQKPAEVKVKPFMSSKQVEELKEQKEQKKLTQYNVPSCEISRAAQLNVFIEKIPLSIR